MEKAKEEKEAFGEIETEHPGYLGAQDTFYVGTLKGSGGFINRHSLIPTAKWVLPRFMIGRIPCWQPTFSMTGGIALFRGMGFRCCGSSRIGVRSFVGIENTTNMSLTWPREHRTQQDPGEKSLQSNGIVSDSMGRFWMNSIG